MAPPIDTFATKAYQLITIANPVEIATLVPRVVEPDTWTRLGGQGTVSGVVIGSADLASKWLVVYQTDMIQTKVKALLDELKISAGS